MTQTQTMSILLVDEKEKALAAVQRRFGERFTMHTARGSEEALQLLTESGPFAVVVSDYGLRDMSRNTFLARVREIDPNIVRVVLTVERNHNLAVQTIDKNEVFRFLKTPCSEKVFGSVLTSALQQYEMRLAAEDRPRVDIMGFVNHELQAPVACIRACAETLVNCKQVGDETRDEFLNTILAETERLGELIPELLETVKSAIGDVELNPAQVEMAQAIQTVRMSDGNAGR